MVLLCTRGMQCGTRKREAEVMVVVYRKGKVIVQTCSKQLHFERTLIV